jgi:hypothetical protein
MYSYRGIAYRQSKDPAAPLLVTFVVPAEELLNWAGIPRRAEENMAGFQRPFDEKRVERAKEFFTLGSNQSPTALVVGIHPVRNDAKRAVEIQFTDDDAAAAIRSCVLNVKFDGAELTTPEIIDLVRRQVDYRLAQSPDTDSDERFLDDDDAEEAVASSTEEEDASNDEDGEEELELGRSMLSMLRGRLDDADWCERNRDALRDIAKPATVIDGQHRVLGAQLCERDIPFTVCALYDCQWAEQVFQFTVVNYTQKGIPDQFITANAALSLTGSELNSLRDRLVQARVHVLEYELMKVVNFDQQSPFYEKVNLGEKPLRDRIGYKTMVRIAKRWYNGLSPDIRRDFLPNLFPEVKGRGASALRLRQWKENEWGKFFIDFWTVVRDHYASHASDDEGHTLWDVGYSNLTIAIVLLDLQEQFFVNLEAQDPDFWEVRGTDSADALRAKLKKRAEQFVSYLPAEFFAAHWGTKSLNTGGERKVLTSALEKLHKQKGRSNWSQFALVTGDAS